MMQAYFHEYARELDKDVAKSASGDFGALLKKLFVTTRTSCTEALNPVLVSADAKALYEAGEKKWGTDEARFIEVL